jgi:hypothetical protein
MKDISFMQRLTLGILVALILFGVTFTFTTGLTTAVNGIATTLAPTAAKPFPQPYWELLLSFAVAFIPIANEVWKHQNNKAEESVLTVADPKKTGTYDPDPIRRRSRRPRKGVEPAGLKRWRLAHRKHGKYDPRRPRRRHMARAYGFLRHKPFRVGSRGGVAWSGAHKLRYDPTRRHPRLRRYGSRIGRGIEGTINKWGTWLGALFGLGYGVYQGITLYNSANPKYGMENYLHTIVGGAHKNLDGTLESTRIPEIAHLWQTVGGWTPDRYLRYKFLGYKWEGEGETFKESYDPTRATWGLPFWLGLGAWIVGKIMPKLPYARKLNRVWKPMSKIGKGVAIVSGIGALALPNPHSDIGYPIPPPQNSSVNPQNSPQNFRIENKYVGAY